MEQASSLLGLMSTAVLILNERGNVVDMNSAAEHLVGASVESIRGNSLLDRLPCIADELMGMVTASIERGQAFAQNLTINGQPLHPEDRIVDCRVGPFAAGGQSEVLIEITDITRRLRVHHENTLLKQHSASRKMVRQLAHEIKNPLGGIRGAAQLLARKIEALDLKQYTDVIVTEVDRLAGLADTLLGPGQLTRKEEVNIHDLLEHVARLTEASDSAGVSIKREYDPSLPHMQLDKDQIIQAIFNLVNNAVAATGEGGQLKFRTCAVPNYTIGATFYPTVVSIEIEDDGPGIPEEIRDSVFFPLVTGRDDGTGLGLSLAQELVNRHDGLIEFVTRPGRTVFTIRLPI